MTRLVIIGKGGHGQVLRSVVEAMRRSTQPGLEFVGFIDKEAGKDVIGRDADLPRLKSSGDIDAFIIGIGSVRGGTSLRAGVFQNAASLGLAPIRAIHPAAILEPDLRIGDGTVIMAGAILSIGVQTGQNVIINTGAILDHDCRIGDHAHVAPGVVMSGNVTVGAHSLVGVGAAVRQGITIGEGATVGAGAVVVSDVPDGAVVMGNPARLRQ